MYETDTLGLELLRAHRGNQLGASARGKDKCDTAVSARVAARGRDEIRQHSGALASRDATAMVGIFAAGGRCAIRRIRDNQVEAGGLDACDFLSQVGTNRVHRLESVDGSAAGDHLGQRWLDLDRDNFARAIKSGHHDRYDAASCSELEHSIA